jgi:hypothetical protein
MRVVQHRVKYAIPVNGDLLDPDWDDDDYEWLLERIRCTGRSDIVGSLGLVTRSGRGTTDKIPCINYMIGLYRSERLKREQREIRAGRERQARLDREWLEARERKRKAAECEALNDRHNCLSGVRDTGH